MAAVEALQPAIVILGAATAAALLSRAVRLSPIVGYLAAGVAIGPFGLGLMSENETTFLLAELGVVFLLFDIGLHFSVKEMQDSRNDILRLAPIQMLLCGSAFSLAAWMLGCPVPIAIAIGVSVGLSSTAVVSRIISDKELGTCPLGRSGIAVLIFQDIVAIFLLIFAGSMGKEDTSLTQALLVAAGQSMLAFVAAVLVGRFLVRPLFRVLAAAKVKEIFTMVAILIVVSASAATGAMGLSLTLGGFLAGLAISDTPYRHVIQTEVTPFRGLLLSFFFINVGMMVDVPAVLGALHVVVLGAVTILLVKSVLVFVAARLSGWSVPGATQLSFLLAQGSEFTLVVLSMPAIAMGAPAGTVGILVAATAVSLALAPAWADLGMRFARFLGRRATMKTVELETTGATASGKRPVIIFGISKSARQAIDALNEFDYPYIALDSDPERFTRALADGYDVAFGDAADFRLIDTIGAANARAIVLGSPRYEISQAITPAVREQFPDMQRFVAVESSSDRIRHEALGIRAFHSVAKPHGIELAAALLESLGIEREKVTEWVEDQTARTTSPRMDDEEEETGAEAA